MKEVTKIALACFIGGAICVLIALLFAPNFKWLGLLVGFGAGYLSYEFKDVLKAIPKAWRIAYRVVYFTGGYIAHVKEEVIKGIKEFFKDLYPFSYPAAIGSLIIFIHLLINITIPHLVEKNEDTFFIFGFVLELIILIGIFLYLLPILSAFLLRGLAFIGSRYWEHCYFKPFLVTKHPQGYLNEEFYRREDEKYSKKLQDKGYKEKKTTCKNILLWMLEGSILITPLFIWMLFKILWKLLRFIKKFLWTLLKLIHSHKRVLCGIDSAIGGGTACLLFASSVQTLPQQILLIIFGGILGALVGVLNYHLVSVRLLKILPIKVNSQG